MGQLWGFVKAVGVGLGPDRLGCLQFIPKNASFDLQYACFVKGGFKIWLFYLIWN